VSEPENFLSRWARLKREAAETPDDAAPETAATESRAYEPAEATASPAPELEFDLSTLPPIESITAATDIRAFLAPGVPPELTRAALRRAWVADPAIRDFVGIAENQWDFNDPNGIPGFGSLGPLDDVRRLVAQVFGEAREEAAAPAADSEEEKALSAKADNEIAGSDATATIGQVTPPPGVQEASVPSGNVDVQCSKSDAALQVARSEDDAPPQSEVLPRRPHGGALPQ
jgi:hypothetical protein